MSLDRSCTVHSPIVDDALGVFFNVRVISGGRAWNYRGNIVTSALSLLGDKSQSFQQIFEAARPRIGSRALAQWDLQDPGAYEFVVNSTNYREGGDFVKGE